MENETSLSERLLRERLRSALERWNREAMRETSAEASDAIMFCCADLKEVMDEEKESKTRCPCR